MNIHKKHRMKCPGTLCLGAIAKLSEAKRNENFSFGGGGQRNSVGPFVFFLEKKLQLKTNFFFFF
jgi:hypothetical protein